VYPEKISPPTGGGGGRNRMQELKDNISHAVANIKVTVLHRVYLKMIRREQLCMNAAGNHFQQLL